MKNKVVSTILVSMATFVFIFVAVPQLFAIGIRPVREEISLPPGQSATGEITVINESDEDFMAEPIIQVFYKTDESGIPVYANDETLEIEDVRSWLDISTEPVNVPANNSTAVSYTVNIPENAEAGGRYMSIAYQPVKEASEGVAINVRAASLLLINVEGDIIKSGELNDFSIPKEIFSDKPFNFNVSFTSTGNTHVKPIGWIEIIDSKTNEKLKEIARYLDPVTGQEIVADKIPVNLTEGNVLPGSTRNFEGEWVENIKEGNFKAVLTLEYDQNTEAITKELPFSLTEEITVDGFKLNTEGDTSVFNFEIKNPSQLNQKISGGISIENVFGYEVAKIPLEETEYLTPGQNKPYQLEWVKPSEIPEGRYTAKLNLSYGLTQKNIVTEFSFGEVDRTKTYLIGALVVVVLIALFAIFKRGKGNSGKKDNKI